MILPKSYRHSLFWLVLHGCILSAILSYTNRQVGADLEGRNTQLNFTDEKPTFPTFEEHLRNCVNNKKDNGRYSSSFTEFDEEPSIVKDPKYVVEGTFSDEDTRSIRIGEDTTLCWIERITIKEDLSFQPSKRLVLKEYAISFENSATIPDDYLDCRKVEGELSPNDTDAGKTVFYEIIDENTKVSRVVNFTRVRNENGIKIWQHKSVKCGMGPIVSKNVTEWDVASENPKRRVEIKVGPKIYSLKAEPKKIKSIWDSVTSTEAIDVSDVNRSDNVVGRMWLTSMASPNNVVDDSKTISTENVKFHEKSELRTETSAKPNSLEAATAEIASTSDQESGHPATSAIEIMEIEDQTTVSPMKTITLNETPPFTSQNINPTESPILPRQRFVLRIKLLLEHTNEEKKKESLIEVKKNVILTGNEARIGQPDFLEQIRALNKSISQEVIEALLNYTSLGELSKFNNVSWITESSMRIKRRSNGEEGNKYSEETIEKVDGVLYGGMTESHVIDDSCYNEIRYNLSNVYEDVTSGLSHMFSIFTDKNDSENDSLKSTESKPSNIINNISSKKSHVRGKTDIMKEVGRWWKERTDKTQIGGHIHSTIELTLYTI